MKIFYVSSLCSEEKFKHIFESSNKKPQQQIRKFHSLLSRGLVSNSINLYVMSRPPVDKLKNEKESLNIEGNNVNYYYLSIIGNPLFKHMILFFNAIICTFKWNIVNRKQKRVVICDILNLTISIPTLLVSKLFGIKSVAIVTDIPSYMKKYKKRKKSLFKNLIENIYTWVCNFFMYRYNSYIFLTEQMNELVNPNNKPSIIIEGMVDDNMVNIDNQIVDKYEGQVVIYAGALHEKYGVKKLIQAFMNLKNENAKLRIYGSGELESEIKNYEKEDKRIKYFGILPNEQVVKEQLKATLLVNPRPSYEDFTKYSFPSKNMEYMVSGTPILTTPLQGMPKEYNKFVYLFDNESVEGMERTPACILDKSKDELHVMGIKAKEFVLREKNNKIQASKIMKMINMLVE